MSVLDEIVVPDGWKFERFDSCFDRIRCVGYPDAAPLSVFLGLGVVLRSSRDDNHNQLGSDLSKYQLVEPSDIVFNRLRTWQGGFGVSRYRGIVSPAYIVARPRVGVDSRFMCFLLLSSGYLSELTRVSKFMPPSQFDILWGDLKCVRILVPPLATQKAIANFLDRKTAAIDALIDKKRRMLDLLAEKRAALINQAVTRGLAPDVPMKDSGVPWIGTIPAHWDVRRACLVAKRIKTGGTPPTGELAYFEDGDIPWFAPASFRTDSIELGEPKGFLHVSALESKKAPRFLSNSVLIVGIGATLGKVCCLESVATANQQVVAVEFDSGFFNARFVAYQFKYREDVFMGRALYTTLPIMNQYDVGEHYVICPPLEEQNSIESYLNREIAEVGLLVSNVRLQIEKIQEYRQSLITAAVTGQLNIDAEEGV